jgi:hypothetical protein
MAPKKKVLTAKEALEKLGVMTTTAIRNSNMEEPTGRCDYTTSSGSHCAVITKAWCDELNGTWTEGQECP